MKVITIHQPFATLIIKGIQKIYVKDWATAHRGEILVHAGRQFNQQQAEFCEKINIKQYLRENEELPFGKIVGKVVLKDIYPSETILGWFENTKGERRVQAEKEMELSDFENHKLGWLLESPMEFKRYLAANGMRSIWDIELPKQIYDNTIPH